WARRTGEFESDEVTSPRIEAVPWTCCPRPPGKSKPPRPSGPPPPLRNPPPPPPRGPAPWPPPPSRWAWISVSAVQTRTAVNKTIIARFTRSGIFTLYLTLQDPQLSLAIC